MMYGRSAVANKTLYIPPGDEELWEAAKRVADLKKTSVYQLIRESLDRQLPIIAAEPAPAEKWAGIAADPQATPSLSPNH